ncbi:MAG: mannose-1-phosphate guanylyltransferase [Clostridia bacterium]|nr:mannose-1-phosphate guanylyltransferase [Clostridia bacterium]
MIFPVILAGGTGTRFWPKSRSRIPKQFLDFVTPESLLQATKRRLNRLSDREQIYVVTNRRYVNKVLEQLTCLPSSNVIVEPLRRDTATCIGLATSKLSTVDPEGVMVIVPSDHYVADEERFLKTLCRGVEAAQRRKSIVTLGINPYSPKTGYGYIEQGEFIEEYSDALAVYKANRFTEKPSLETAKEYLDSGRFYWNCGIFICRVSVMLEAIHRHMPRLAKGLDKIKSSIGTPQETEVVKKEYRDMEKVSIDYGIMEKASNIEVIPCEFGWDDVGSWSILDNMLIKDNCGNAVKGNCVNIDTNNCIIDSDGNRLVATIGVDDLIIVNTKDVVLVCRKDKDQEVKELVKKVKEPRFRRYW